MVTSIRDIREIVNTEIVSPKEFLRIYAEERDNIESAQIVPYEPGNKDSGKIKIIWKYPVFRPRRMRVS
jgi:hypothetical protein